MKAFLRSEATYFTPNPLKASPQFLCYIICNILDLVLTGVNFNFSLQRMSHAVDTVLSYT